MTGPDVLVDSQPVELSESAPPAGDRPITPSRSFSWWWRLAGPPVLFIGYALLLAWPLLVDPRRRLFVATEGSDQVILQFMLAHTAYAVTHLSNPFLTDQLNAPIGVDLACQVNIVGLGVPLTPITLLFGAQVSYALVVLCGMAGTATAWYWLFSGKLRLHWAAGALGAMVCAFCPQLMMEATGRNHITVQVLVPLIIWQVCQLKESARPVLTGALLGALVAWQALIGEEVLLLTGLAVGVWCSAVVIQRPRLLRAAASYARGLASTTVTAGLLLCYPLWQQFRGPGHVHNFPIDVQQYTSAVSNYLGLPPRWAELLPGPLAATSWWSLNGRVVLGLPLVLLLACVIVALRRQPAVPACGITLLVFAVLSQGAKIRIGSDLTIPGPWAFIGRLPVVRFAMPYRLGLVPVAMAGTLLAFGADSLLRQWRAEAASCSMRSNGQNRWLGRRFVALTLATIVGGTLYGLSATQLRPRQLPTQEVAAVPRFIASGAWRPYLDNGYTLVTVPLTSSVWLDGQRWSAATGIGFPLANGYFIGPDPGQPRSRFGAPVTWTEVYLDVVAHTGQVAATGEPQRARFIADLKRWNAGLLVLGPVQPNRAALRHAVEQLIGPAKPDQDMLVWDVRHLR